MKRHYYFVNATVTYTEDGGRLQRVHKTKGSYEVIQESYKEDPVFFLGLEGYFHREVKKSFLGSYPYIKEGQVVAVRIDSISKLN